MQYIEVAFSANGPLGLALVQRRPTDPNLGDSVVECLQQTAAGYPGQAELGSVLPGDFVVAVADAYVADRTNAEVINVLRSSQRPVRVLFARPDTSAWRKARETYSGGAGGLGVVLAGVLQKQAGWWNSWSDRRFLLTRHDLRYFEDGDCKRTIPLAEVTAVAPGRARDSGHPQHSFVVAHPTKDLLALAPSAAVQLRWMHGVDTARKRAFMYYYFQNPKKDTPACFELALAVKFFGRNL